MVRIALLLVRCAAWCTPGNALVRCAAWCTPGNAPRNTGTHPSGNAPRRVPPLLARPPRRSELADKLDALRPARLNATIGALRGRANVTLDAEARRVLREKLERTSRRTSRVVRVFAGDQFKKNLFALFESMDVDQDGRLSVDEAYPVVLQLYILANRQAPVNPPSRGQIAKLFDAADADGSGALSKDEFVVFCTALLGRTASRIAVFNVVRFAVAPVLATALARELSSNWIFRVEPSVLRP